MKKKIKKPKKKASYSHFTAMVLDKKFNLVLTKSTLTDGLKFTSMVISVKKVPA